MVWTFDEAKLHAAGERFVEDGAPGNDARALRQQEVDGALNFLKSEAAAKLRVAPSPSRQGILNAAPATTLPPAPGDSA